MQSFFGDFFKPSTSGGSFVGRELQQGFSGVAYGCQLFLPKGKYVPGTVQVFVNGLLYSNVGEDTVYQIIELSTQDRLEISSSIRFDSGDHVIVRFLEKL